MNLGTSRLYKFALEIYFQFKPHSTKDFEGYWANRKSGKDWHFKQTDWLDGYWKSIDHPHRKLLVDTIMKYEPKSVLELGCNVGINLELVNRRSPKTLCLGIDINEDCIKYGIEKYHFKDKNNNIWLLNYPIDRLYKLRSMRFDVVFSDASLIYIGEDKINTVFEQIGLRTTKAVVFLERHLPNGDGKSVYKDGLWNRNYVKLIREYLPEFNNIKETKITKDIWSEWLENGYIIDAWR